MQKINRREWTSIQLILMPRPDRPLLPPPRPSATRPRAGGELLAESKFRVSEFQVFPQRLVRMNEALDLRYDKIGLLKQVL